ncbi:MAG: DUF560 domain-containing protein [Gammaproteobacteria bacterium]|nr:DUF560 domain-containing protein [Gammaproteobacteria bacterium]
MSINLKKTFSSSLFTLFIASAPISFADFDAGVSYYKAGDYKQAETEFLKQLSANPNSALSYYYLGLLYSSSQDYSKSTSAFKKAKRLDKSLPNLDYNIGVNYYHLRLSDMAILHFKKAEKNDPDNANNLMFLGLTYQFQLNHEQAISYFKKARQANSEFAQLAVFNSAISYQKTGNKAQQRAHLEEAVKINPDNDIADNSRQILDAMSGKSYGPIETKQWKFSGSIGFEHDDNVTVDEVNLSTNKSDNAVIIEFSAENLIFADEIHEVEIGYDLYQSLYHSYDDFDLQSHSFYVDGTRKYNNFDLGLNYRYNFNTLGDNKFFGSHALRPSIWYSINDTWFLDTFYRYEDKKFYKNSDRDADKNSIGLINYVFLTPDDMLIVGADLNDEDTKGDEFDYDGYSISISYEKTLHINAKEIVISAGYDYEDRDYDNITPSIGEKRDDKRKDYSLDIEYPITKLFSSVFYYQHIDSDSNLESSDYNENIVGIKLEAHY